MEENSEKDKEPSSLDMSTTKSKTVSISSTESLSSDIICLTEHTSNNNNASLLSNSNKQKEYNDDETLFDFTKTGAIPKNKSTKNQLNSKSSLSSSTSSSLSSLISSAPSTFSSCSSNNLKSNTKKKYSNSTNNSSNTNDYWMPDNKIIKGDEEELLNANVLNEEVITCPLCFKTIETNLESHFESEHNEFECPFCDLLFDNGLNLNQHVNIVHTDTNENMNTYNNNNNNINNRKESVIASSSVGSGSSSSYLFDSKLPNYAATSGGATSSNWGQSDFKSVSDSVNEQKCPVCMVVVKDLDYLQAHVESHFNNNNNNNDDDITSNSYDDYKTKSRTQSSSSLIANVDENFEMDQVMTLADSDSESSRQDQFDYYSFQNDDKMQKDYEMALMLERQENNTGNDFILAQMYERQQSEAIKFQLKSNSEENVFDEADYSTETSSNFQSDFEYAAELEHEWLRQKYGMTEVKASTKAHSNLDQALKQNKIDIVTYNYEKDQIEMRVNSLIDDASTCSKEIIQLIESVPLNKTTKKRILCSKCDHYASGFIDSGYGCGYRNTQMMLSAIREDYLLRDVLFNNNNKNMPSITKIQQMIENAWNNGFDLAGKQQLGGSIKNTAKWIGASDICAMFSCLRIKTELVDIQVTPDSKSSISSVLFKFVRNYFEEAIKTGDFIHPIYLQHDGHSRLIVGIELGQHENLLLFDPGTRKQQIEQFRKNNSKFIYLFRRGPASFNKKKEYQLLLMTKHVLKSNEEYENAKLLTSKKVNS